MNDFSAEASARSRMLIGDEGLTKLQNSKIAIFGLGGVGSYAAEALARSGVGHLVLVDYDTVSPSNLNRQLVALTDTLGQKKTDIMLERIAKINPQVNVEAIDQFYLPGEDLSYLAGCDYVLDAIDTITAKLSLIEQAKAKELPIISAMGCGDRLDPSQLQIADIQKTTVCPLCRVMRTEMRKRGLGKLTVVYSTEEPIAHRGEDASLSQDSRRKHTPASMVFVPASAGLLMASFAARAILEML